MGVFTIRKLEKRMQKVNLFLIRWGEIFPILAILYFYNAATRQGFMLVYGIVLFVIWLMKFLLRRVRNNTYTDNFMQCSLFPFVIVLLEFGIVFLSYTDVGNDGLSKTILWAIVPLISYFVLLKLRNEESLFPNWLWYVGFAVLCSAFAILCIVINESSYAIEFLRLCFALWIIFAVDKCRSRNWCLSFSLVLGILIVASFMLILVGELGTILVLCIAAWIYFFTSNQTVSFKERKFSIKAIAFGILAVCVIVWIVIHFFGLNLLEQYTTSKRIFIWQNDDEQLAQLYQVAYKRSALGTVINLVIPQEYREILTSETGSIASVEDYLFSVLTYSMGKIYALVIALLTFAFFSYSIYRHYKNSNESGIRIIPILLFSQTFVHVFGNLMLFSFTGIPYPFLSHGLASLFCNMIMLCVLTEYERKGELF